MQERTTTIGEFNHEASRVLSGNAIVTNVAFPCNERDANILPLGSECELKLHAVCETPSRILFRLVEVTLASGRHIFSAAVYGRTEGVSYTLSSGDEGISFTPLHTAEWEQAARQVARRLAEYLRQVHGHTVKQAARRATELVRKRLMFINQLDWEQYEPHMTISSGPPVPTSVN